MPVDANVLSRWKRWDKVLLGAFCLILVAVPYVIPSFWLRIATGMFMWITLASSWNIIGGYGGYISFGHAAFFGLGAYLTGVLMGQDISFFMAMLIAGTASVVSAVILGYPTLRLRGAYFAIATWAFAEVVKQVVLVLPVTGGPFGLRLPALLNDAFFYYLMLCLTTVTVLTVYVLLECLSFGLKVKVVREDEIAAQTIAINTSTIKVQAFALSAFFTAITGSAYAYWITYIHPESVMSAIITDQMVVMALLGGLGTVLGPIIGASLLYVSNRVFWVIWGDTSFYLVLLGLAICSVILFLPEGLVSLMRGKRRQVAGALLETRRIGPRF